MSVPLTVHNAQVTTATVEIKTLSISGKQVTLAVFRQLLEKELISDEGTFNGEPWGTVNYHPDKCADSGSHLHAVWQDGIELRRALVREPRWHPPFWDKSCDVFVQTASCVNHHNYLDWTRRNQDGDLVFVADDLQCVANPPKRGDPHGCLTDREQAACMLREAIATERQRRARCRQRWSELVALPQLFIAI